MYMILVALLAAQAVLVGRLFGWKLVRSILGVAGVVIVLEFLLLYSSIWMVIAYVLGIAMVVRAMIRAKYVRQ